MNKITIQFIVIFLTACTPKESLPEPDVLHLFHTYGYFSDAEHFPFHSNGLTNVRSRFGLIAVDFDLSDNIFDFRDLLHELKKIDESNFTQGDINYDLVGGFLETEDGTRNIIVGVVMDSKTYANFLSLAQRSSVTDVGKMISGIEDVLEKENSAFQKFSVGFLNIYSAIKIAESPYVFVINPYADIYIKNLDYAANP